MWEIATDLVVIPASWNFQFRHFLDTNRSHGRLLRVVKSIRCKISEKPSSMVMPAVCSLGCESSAQPAPHRLWSGASWGRGTAWQEACLQDHPEPFKLVLQSWDRRVAAALDGSSGPGRPWRYVLPWTHTVWGQRNGGGISGSFRSHCWAPWSPPNPRQNLKGLGVTWVPTPYILTAHVQFEGPDPWLTHSSANTWTPIMGTFNSECWVWVFLNSSFHKMWAFKKSIPTVMLIF